MKFDGRQEKKEGTRKAGAGTNQRLPESQSAAQL
jgi:hypothetical protein